MFEGPYLAGLDSKTADFIFLMLPLGIGRDMAMGAIAAIDGVQGDFYAKLESKGYSIQRGRDFVTQTFESRNGSIFMDRQKSLELVFNGRVQIARGEAVGYAGGGIVVRDQTSGEERQINADGIVLAIDFEDVDIAQLGRHGLLGEQAVVAAGEPMHAGHWPGGRAWYCDRLWAYVDRLADLMGNQHADDRRSQPLPRKLERLILSMGDKLSIYA